MISLAGLSATYPGFQQGQSADIHNDQQALLLQNAQAENAGKNALGVTLKGLMGGAAPTPPAAGQRFGEDGPAPQPSSPFMNASVPPVPMQPNPAMMQNRAPAPLPVNASIPPRPMGGNPTMAGGAGPQQGPPQAMGNPQPPPQQQSPFAPLEGKFDLKTAAQAIAKANPDIQPRVLVEALHAAMPFLQPDARQEITRMRMQMLQEQMDNKREGLIEKKREFDERMERTRDQDEQRQKNFEAKEQRLGARTAIQQDQGWQRLELQKQDLQRKLMNGDRSASLKEWRSVLDAQDKLARAKLSAYSINNAMDDKQKAAFIKELEEQKEQQLEEMRTIKGSSTPTGGTPTASGAKTSERAPQGKPIPFAVRQEFDAAIAAGKDKQALLKKMEEEGYRIEGL